MCVLFSVSKTNQCGLILYSYGGGALFALLEVAIVEYYTNKSTPDFYHLSLTIGKFLLPVKLETYKIIKTKR